jgi:hypothetical protein
MGLFSVKVLVAHPTDLSRIKLKLLPHTVLAM